MAILAWVVQSTAVDVPGRQEGRAEELAACQNGWQGIVVNGCIRDAAAIAKLPIGIRALNTHPLKSGKRGTGQENLPVTFAGVTFRPGEYLYADEDGLVVSASRLI